MAAEGRYDMHFAERTVSDNEAESELETAIAESLEGNAGYENLQTIPDIGPWTATQLVVPIGISEFDSHDKLASYRGLTPSTQQSGASINYNRGHRGGNKPLKNLLIFSCNSLVWLNGYSGEYMRRCLDRSMEHKYALKATVRKRMKVISSCRQGAQLRIAEPHAGRIRPLLRCERGGASPCPKVGASLWKTPQITT